MTERMLQNMYSMQVDEYLEKHLFQNPRYQSLKRINKFEFQAFSQHGEDGIIEEIFNRIGVTNKYFIEFGVENGTESNSTYLLFKGWQGLWIEGNPAHVSAIGSSCKGLIEEKRLVVRHSFVNAGNIQTLFAEAGAPAEPDLLSIDIDRNDYHVWKAITNFQPRVVILEYNAIFRPGTAFVIEYDGEASWDKSSNFGASLQSYYELGLQKGYALVGCDFTGTNAFFVRNDLLGQHFEPPFTPENYYEPPRYFLTKKDGHPRKLVF